MFVPITDSRWLPPDRDSRSCCLTFPVSPRAKWSLKVGDHGSHRPVFLLLHIFFNNPIKSSALPFLQNYFYFSKIFFINLCWLPKNWLQTPKGHTPQRSPRTGTLGTFSNSSACTKWKLTQLTELASLGSHTLLSSWRWSSSNVMPNLEVLNNWPVSKSPASPLLIQQEKGTRNSHSAEKSEVEDARGIVQDL